MINEKTLEAAIQFTGQNEGHSITLYRDTEGYPTGGYGFALHSLSVDEVRLFQTRRTTMPLCPRPEELKSVPNYHTIKGYQWGKAQLWIPTSKDGKYKVIDKDAKTLKEIPDDVFYNLQELLLFRQADSKRVLREKVENLLPSIVEHFPRFLSLSKCRQTALIDLSYNMGSAWPLKFPKATALLNQEQWKPGALELLRSKYTKQVQHRALRVAMLLLSADKQRQMDAGVLKVWDKFSAA